MRRWKFEKPHDGQVQSPGLGRFLLGGKGVRISAARSRTLLDDGETSIAFSLSARPFIHRLSAAFGLSAKMEGEQSIAGMISHVWLSVTEVQGGGSFEGQGTWKVNEKGQTCLLVR